jgi:hypothetical protein
MRATMPLCGRVYSAILLLYPRALRREFGQEMVQVNDSGAPFKRSLSGLFRYTNQTPHSRPTDGLEWGTQNLVPCNSLVRSITRWVKAKIDFGAAIDGLRARWEAASLRSG